MDVDQQLQNLSASDKRILKSAMEIFCAEATKSNQNLIDRIKSMEDSESLSELTEMMSEYIDDLNTLVAHIRKIL